MLVRVTDEWESQGGFKFGLIQLSPNHKGTPKHFYEVGPTVPWLCFVMGVSNYGGVATGAHD